MIPNKFVIFWDNMPVGLDSNSGGYPFKTENPNQIKYWNTRDEAEKYCIMFLSNMMLVYEIQFGII